MFKDVSSVVSTLTQTAGEQPATRQVVYNAQGHALMEYVIVRTECEHRLTGTERFRVMHRNRRKALAQRKRRPL